MIVGLGELQQPAGGVSGLGFKVSGLRFEGLGL